MMTIIIGFPKKKNVIVAKKIKRCTNEELEALVKLRNSSVEAIMLPDKGRKLASSIDEVLMELCKYAHSVSELPIMRSPRTNLLLIKSIFIVLSFR